MLLATILAIVIVVAASGCSSTATPTPEPTVDASPVASTHEVTAEGRLEPRRYAMLAASTDGSVSQVLVGEGDEVLAGQVIAQLQNAKAQTLEAAQASAALNLANAYQALHDSQGKLDDFAIPAKFNGMTAEQATRTSLANLEAARVAFEPYKGESVQGYRLNHNFPSLPTYIYVDTKYYKSGLAREYKKQLDNAWVDYRKGVMWLDLQSALESAQAQVVQAQKDYDSLQDASLAENTAGARAALANAELRAPFAGTITNLDLKVGEFAASGSPVVTVADFSSWVVKTTDLTEIDVVNVKEGEPVTLTLDAIPGVTLKGYVLSIGQNYSEKQGDIVYEVTVLLTDKQPAMRWGMTAEVNFRKGE
jgi:multidrug efflux pump subunit AcrA (membrane-fusion protein)